MIRPFIEQMYGPSSIPSSTPSPHLAPSFAHAPPKSVPTSSSTSPNPASQHPHSKLSNITLSKSIDPFLYNQKGSVSTIFSKLRSFINDASTLPIIQEIENAMEKEQHSLLNNSHISVLGKKEKKN